MSDDLLIHFSSNSSNQSDPGLPTKLAKLEARMAGKGSSTTPLQASWSSVSSAKFGVTEDLAAAESTSSDSEDNSGGDFLIQPHAQKRLKLQEDDHSTIHHQSEVVADGRNKTGETGDTKTGSEDANRKKQSRGRGRSATGRGRGSKANEQTRPQISSTVLSSNGQLENLSHKENRPKEQFGIDERASLEEEVTSLRLKVASLEEELRKAREEASDHGQLCRQLEKVEETEPGYVED